MLDTSEASMIHVFMLNNKLEITCILVYVDDLIDATTSGQLFEDFQLVMNNTVVIKDLGNLHYYIGLQFE